MDLTKVDINLLVVFDMIFRKRSVTEAGQQIGLSQSSVSYSLAKLRKMFNDPLFVKTPKGMLPTPLAEKLSIPIASVLSTLSNDIFQYTRFDPVTTDRTFKICMSDIGEIAFLPYLVHRFKVVAPNANIKSIDTTKDSVKDMLESGNADLALGYFPDLQAGFYQQGISEHTFVCIVSENNPYISDKLTLQQFTELPHAVVNVSGRSQEVVEEAISQMGIKRRVLLEIPHYSVIPLVIQDTNLIVTIPRVVGTLFQKLAKIKILPTPVDFPTFSLRQHWHVRYNADPANMWLRNQITELFQGKQDWW
jgi:DNA-binding transcriptional LysR family regulator